MDSPLLFIPGCSVDDSSARNLSAALSGVMSRCGIPKHFKSNHEFSYSCRPQQRRIEVRMEMPFRVWLRIGWTLVKSHGVWKAGLKQVVVAGGHSFQNIRQRRLLRGIHLGECADSGAGSAPAFQRARPPRTEPQQQIPDSRTRFVPPIASREQQCRKEASAMRIHDTQAAQPAPPSVHREHAPSTRPGNADGDCWRPSSGRDSRKSEHS